MRRPIGLVVCVGLLAGVAASCAKDAIARHMRTDVATLLPMDMVVADMVPDNVGTWLFHCHTGPHLRAGMASKYVVTDRTIAAPVDHH